MANTDRDQKLVDGYVRLICNEINIPKEILTLIFIWCHLELFIFKMGDRFQLNEEKTIITRNDDKKLHSSTIINYGSCYGSISMPSMNNKLIYEYRIKVLKLNDEHVGIGIYDAICKHINTYFIEQTATSNYGLQCWNGTKASHNAAWEKAEIYAAPCKDKDTDITMIYNAYKSTLSFSIDGKDYGIAYDNIDKREELDYRLTIYLACDASVELTGFSTKSAV